MPINFDVTRKILQLGSRDATTGWYTQDYNTTETIEMIIVTRATAYTPLPPGVYVRRDAVGLTADNVVEGDQIVDAANNYYEVETVQPHYWGDSFVFRECDLTLLPLENLSGGSYTESSVDDARYRTKVYLETYLSSSALPNYIVAYGMPNYPLTCVFKEKGVDLVFSLGEPESVPLLSANHAVYGYREHVPITVCCVDKTNITAAKLKWQAETELRRILEEYPLGSLRSFERRRDTTQRLGSTILYMTEFRLTYVRDTS